MDYELRELRIGDPQEAQLLADMWNASESGWPGGWTGGIPETAERVLEQTQRIHRIAIFVVEVNDEIVGYGDMRQQFGLDGVAELDLLNVRPDFHGKGLGKALVLKVLERFKVQPIDALGKPFDPAFHQAVMQEEADNGVEPTVLKELQKGYMIHNRLLRPAMVVVSKARETRDDAGDNPEEKSPEEKSPEEKSPEEKSNDKPDEQNHSETN